MKTRAIAGFFLFLSLPYSSNAQYAESFAKPNNNNHFGFIENKGQIIDQNNIPNPAVLYLLNTPGMNVQLRRGGFSYDLYRISPPAGRAGNIEQGILNDERNHNSLPSQTSSIEHSESSIEHPASVYQWDELMQYDDTPGLQGLCPPGWHIPTENDWNTLFANYINNAFAGSPLKYSGYSGFNALLSGVRHLNVQWDFQNFATFFWSSIPYGVYKAWAHGMNDYNPSVSLYPSSRANAFSVRCTKD